MGQPRLGLDRQHIGVDGVAGRQVLGAARIPDAAVPSCRIPEVFGQYRRRWNGYVGSSSRRPAVWNRAAKSGWCPQMYVVASASVICRWALAPLRNDTIARGVADDSGQICSAAAVRIGCGPISISTEHPRVATVRTLSVNCTGCRECLRQYCALIGVSAVSTAPVRLQTSGRVGTAYSNCVANFSNSSSTGSRSSEWKAWLVSSQVHRRRPRCTRRRSAPDPRPGPRAPCCGRCRHRPRRAGSSSPHAPRNRDRRTPRPSGRPRAGCRTIGPARRSSGYRPRAEYACHARGRVLADAVAQHHVRFDAPRLPQPGQTHLDGEDRRLGE